jgi:hypothetical protein
VRAKGETGFKLEDPHKASRIHVDKDVEEWADQDLSILSVDYPINSYMRWDRIPSNNNEDLFRGILCDYSALEEGYQDRIGQGIMFGVNHAWRTMTYPIHTASYRGVYRTSGTHEAHICVGVDDKDERAIKVIVNANTERVKVSSPIMLDNLYGKDNINAQPGSLATYYEDNQPAKLLFYTGTSWNEVQLGEVQYEE